MSWTFGWKRVTSPTSRIFSCVIFYNKALNLPVRITEEKRPGSFDMFIVWFIDDVKFSLNGQSYLYIGWVNTSSSPKSLPEYTVGHLHCNTRKFSEVFISLALNPKGEPIGFIYIAVDRSVAFS